MSQKAFPAKTCFASVVLDANGDPRGTYAVAKELKGGGYFKASGNFLSSTYY
jgi:hypothetical protein